MSKPKPNVVDKWSVTGRFLGVQMRGYGQAVIRSSGGAKAWAGARFISPCGRALNFSKLVGRKPLTLPLPEHGQRRDGSRRLTSGLGLDVEEVAFAFDDVLVDDVL